MSTDEPRPPRAGAAGNAGERGHSAILDAEERYRAVFEASRDGKIIYALDGTVVDANPAACAMYGYGQDEIVGVHAPSVIHPDALPAFREFQRIVSSGREFHCETVDRRRDGTPFPIEVVGNLLTINGDPHLMSVIRDISERKRVEEQLRRSHDTFYNLIQNNPFGVYVVDADFKLRQVSRGSQKVFATVPEPLLGRDFAQVLRAVWAEPFATQAIETFQHTLATGEPYASPRTVERRQDLGEVESYDWRIERITLPDGRFGVVCYFYDLSERQQWEGALAETRRKLDSALIAGEVGIFEWDVIADRLWGDRNFARIFGVELDPSGAAPLATYLAMVHADDRDFVVEQLTQVVETGCDYKAEYRIPTGGQTRWVVARGKIERDHAGRAVRFPGVVLDVTERKQAEQLLAAQNRALERMAAGRPLAETLGALTTVVEEQSAGEAIAAILIVDEDGCTLRTGAAPGLPEAYSAAIDGLKAKPGVGTCADAAARNEVVVTPDLAAAPSWQGLSHLPLALGLKAAWSMPIRAPDRRVLGTFGTYFRERREPTDRERQVVEGLCRVAALAIDRRRAEAALQESERRFRELADAMPQMVWVTRPDGYHEYYNRRWYEFTGVPEGSTDGEGWNGMFHPEDQERAWAVWRQSLASGEPYEVEYRLRHRSGEYRWTLGRALPIRDTDGAITRWFGTCTDIDTLKRLQQDREALLDRERAASQMKDEFLATLSHELRTPLNAILGWSRILDTGARDEEDLREGLQAIERNARAQAQIIEDLLDMSRIISGKVRLDVQWVDLARIVQDAVATAKPSADAKGIRLQPVIDPHAGPVSGDPARLQQVLWNLLTNAVKFTPRGGRVQVLLERINSHVEVSVTDTGEGITPDFLPFVFDRFRQADATTTRRHGGLGLGLSIVKQLVELHGGTIRVRSGGAGQGATFTIALPITVIQPEPDLTLERHHPTVSSAPMSMPGNCAGIEGVKVLVVDDEPDARALLRRVLEGCDAVVFTAGSAAEALEVLRRERPRVLVSDIGMPGEDGYTLIKRVREQEPDEGGRVSAIALTAYARAEDRVNAIVAGFDMHVAKPVEPAELIAMVASLAARAM